jgi:hypothetical protein
MRRPLVKRETDCMQRTHFFMRDMIKKKSGQMTVELAVCVPVVLAVVGVMLNVMGYLNVCARFDRVAAESVRIEATSPGFASYSAMARAERIRSLIQESFDAEQNSFNVEVMVTVSSGSTGEALAPGRGLSFSLLPQTETFTCSIIYRPWPFEHFAGLNFFTLTHERRYCVDPYRPGIFL